MTLSIAHLSPLVSLIAGILILLMPRLLNYIVAFYLIFHRPRRPQCHPSLHGLIWNPSATFGLASSGEAVIFSGPTPVTL